MTLKYPDDKYVGKAEDVVLEPAQVAVVCIGAVNIIIIWLSRHWQWEGGLLVIILPTAIMTTQSKSTGMKGGVSATSPTMRVAACQSFLYYENNSINLPLTSL